MPLRTLVLCALCAGLSQGAAAGKTNLRWGRSLRQELEEAAEGDEDFGDLEDLVQEELKHENPAGVDEPKAPPRASESSPTAVNLAASIKSDLKADDDPAEADDATPTPSNRTGRVAQAQQKAVSGVEDEEDDEEEEEDDGDSLKASEDAEDSSGGIESEFADWLEKRHEQKQKKRVRKHKELLGEEVGGNATESKAALATDEEEDDAEDLDEDLGGKGKKRRRKKHHWAERQHHLPATAEEEFLQNAAKKAMEDKDRAEAEMARNADVEKEAQRKIEAGKQLIKDIEMKKQNALKVAAQTAREEKKKAEEASAEAIARAAAYEREVEKGKQEHAAVEQAKGVKDKAVAELRRIQKDIQVTKKQVQNQNAIAASAAAEAAEERKLADKVASVMGEASHVEKLKDAARKLSDSKKRLEAEFRSRTPGITTSDENFVDEIVTGEKKGKHGKHKKYEDEDAPDDEAYAQLHSLGTKGAIQALTADDADRDEDLNAKLDTDDLEHENDEDPSEEDILSSMSGPPGAAHAQEFAAIEAKMVAPAGPPRGQQPQRAEPAKALPHQIPRAAKPAAPVAMVVAPKAAGYGVPTGPRHAPVAAV